MNRHRAPPRSTFPLAFRAGVVSLAAITLAAYSAPYYVNAQRKSPESPAKTANAKVVGSDQAADLADERFPGGATLKTDPHEQR